MHKEKLLLFNDYKIKMARKPEKIYYKEKLLLFYDNNTNNGKKA